MMNFGDVLLGRAVNHIEHFIARAHRVIVDFTRRAFLIAEFNFVSAKQTVPSPELMVDEVAPAVCPDLVVPDPVAVIAVNDAFKEG